MRPGYKGLKLSPILCKDRSYPNIKTCKLNYLQPQLVINYSNIPCSYFKKPKLVLAHKMHGFPYLDYNGVFGISNRDNYIIYKDTLTDLIKLYEFLSLNFVQQYFEATRYRMMFLEKYAFD